MVLEILIMSVFCFLKFNLQCTLTLKEKCTVNMFLIRKLDISHFDMEMHKWYLYFSSFDVAFVHEKHQNF